MEHMKPVLMAQKENMMLLIEKPFLCRFQFPELCLGGNLDDLTLFD
jgi:hypothetical protein